MVLAKDALPDSNKKSKEDWENEFDSKDKSGNIKKIEQKTRLYLILDREWREEAKEDFKFAFGDQWTKAERDLLTDEGRPCLTFNKIEPLIDLVSGWQRENSMRIRIFPEGGEDKIFSEIGDKCLNAIDKWTKLGYKLDSQFDDGITCGKGWLEMAISYDDDIVFGDLIFRNPTVYQILPDPNSQEYDLSDAEDCIKLSKQSKGQLKKLFPKKAKEIGDMTVDNTEYLISGDVQQEGDASNYDLGKTYKSTAGEFPHEGEVEKFLLKELFFKKYIVKFYVFNYNDNRLENFSDRKVAEARVKVLLKEENEKFEIAMNEYETVVKPAAMATQMASGQAAELPKPPVKEEIDIRVIERAIPEMWYIATVAGLLIQEEVRSPLAPHWDGFPYFRYKAKWSVSAENEKLATKGITRNIKDPQREINKSRSQFLHIINTAANSGWVGDKDALSPNQWKDLKKMGSTPGVTIKKKKGSDLKKIEPSGVEMNQQMRGDKGESDIKEISGINPDAMAIQDKTTSGKAISLRIKQALTILAKYFRNFRWTKELVGQATFSMIPHILNVTEIRKILGTKWMEENEVDDSHIRAFLAQVKDGKYDIKITEADNTATIRQETFENLMGMADAGMPIPPDVILEYSSMANSKDIIDRVKQYIEAQQGAPAK